MPVIALVFGQPDFESIGQFACEGGECAGSVGAVITALVNFLLIAFALFLIVKAYNKMQRKQPDTPEPEADPDDVVLLREIRDALTSSDARGCPGGPGTTDAARRPATLVSATAAAAGRTRPARRR
jgi:large conductance mechanosensitive channel